MINKLSRKRKKLKN